MKVSSEQLNEQIGEVIPVALQQSLIHYQLLMDDNIGRDKYKDTHVEAKVLLSHIWMQIKICEKLGLIEKKKPADSEAAGGMHAMAAGQREAEQYRRTHQS